MPTTFMEFFTLVKTTQKFFHIKILEHYTIGAHVKNFSKIFPRNDPSRGVKTCGESEFDIFEAKNTSLIQGRPVY
jgi:hypothetical protein